MPSAASALQIHDNMASCKHQSRQNEDVPSDWMKVTAFLVMVDITTYPWTKCAFRTSRPGIHHTLSPMNWGMCILKVQLFFSIILHQCIISSRHISGTQCLHIQGSRFLRRAARSLDPPRWRHWLPNDTVLHPRTAKSSKLHTEKTSKPVYI